jgi:serine/threonine protein kinase
MLYPPNHTLLDKYRIERFIGAGAFAEVYQARHLALNAPRALKVLRRDASGLGSTEFGDGVIIMRGEGGRQVRVQSEEDEIEIKRPSHTNLS